MYKNSALKRDSIIGFGKHRGKSIQRLHSGTNQITLNDSSVIATYYLSNYIRAKNIDNKDIENLRDITINIMSTKDASITKGLIGDDTHECINALLRNNGDPNYILWCIQNLETFYLHENELKYLETQEVYSVNSVYIESVKLIDNSCELSFDLKYSTSKFIYPDYIHNENRKKFEIMY
jgi:hypothetical protein